MPCPSPAVPGAANADITDLLFLHPFTASTLHKPQERAQLVAAVMQTAQAGRSLRAHGTNWSLSNAGVAEDVVDTSALGLHICQPYPNPGQPLGVQRMRGAGGDFLARACARDAHTSGRHFVHVEAGIKIRDLLEDLARCGLALPTMGDGAGQSLIGAISTATHGGDFQVPPLVEWVRAVHLVSATGQEVWVTPSVSAFGHAPLVTQLPDWCPDTRFIADDAAFAAVRVGVGRMGVVYSVVIEVVPQYTLIEVNLEHRWSEIRAQLTTSHISGTTTTGVFDAPMTDLDLDSGWFRSELLKHTYYLPSGQGWAFSGPEKWPAVPAFFDAHPEVYVDVLADLKLTALADDLRGGPPMPLHHINLVISLSTSERCWIRRRWKRALPVRDFHVAPSPDDELLAAVKANKSNPPGIVERLKDRLKLDPVVNFIGWLIHDPRVPRLDWYLDHEIAHIAQQHADIGATSGEALFLVLHRIATDQVLDQRENVDSAVSEVIAGGFSRLARGGRASGSLHQNILDAHDYDLDGAQSGNSAEFHFDAASGGYLAFIDEVIALASGPLPAVFGYIGVRFTPASSALIAMQQYTLTASVEVSTARSRLDDLYAGFWSGVHDIARSRGGIPHWGQEIRHTDAELAALYGARLLRWRIALADIAAGAPQVFSTNFSRNKGLEPYEQPAGPAGMDDDAIDAIDLFMLALEAAVD